MKEVPPRAQDTGEGPRSEPEEDTRQQYDPDEATRQAKVLIAQWLASPDPDWMKFVKKRVKNSLPQRCSRYLTGSD